MTSRSSAEAAVGRCDVPELQVSRKPREEPVWGRDGRSRALSAPPGHLALRAEVHQAVGVGVPSGLEPLPQHGRAAESHDGGNMARGEPRAWH